MKSEAVADGQTLCFRQGSWQTAVQLLRILDDTTIIKDQGRPLLRFLIDSTTVDTARFKTKETHRQQFHQTLNVVVTPLGRWIGDPVGKMDPSSKIHWRPFSKAALTLAGSIILKSVAWSSSLYFWQTQCFFSIWSSIRNCESHKVHGHCTGGQSYLGQAIARSAS